MYNLDIHCFYKETAPENLCRNKTVIDPFNLTVRQMMRDMGDAMKNKHGGDFWINLTQQLIEVTVAKDPSIRGFIIEDVRYGENNPWGEAGDEQKAIHDWGGFVFHIQRPDLERTELHNSHSSEDGITPIENDQVVVNNGSLEDLQKTLTDLTNSLGLTKL